MSSAEKRPTDGPAKRDPPACGVGVVSNDAAANRGPPRIPVLPRLANDVCEEFEGVVGTDVNVTEDVGGVMSRDSSSMGGRLLRGLPHLAAGCETSESGYQSALRKEKRTGPRGRLASGVILTSGVVFASRIILRGVETSCNKRAGDPSISVSIGETSRILLLQTSARLATEVVR
jgi:hypothetical protein